MNASISDAKRSRPSLLGGGQTKLQHASSTDAAVYSSTIATMPGSLWKPNSSQKSTSVP
jgi:hypothetical protein